MDNYPPIEDAPSQLRVIFTLLFSVLLAAFSTPMLEQLRNSTPVTLQTGWDAPTDTLMNIVYLCVAMILCGMTWRLSGLGIGDSKRWKRHVYHIVFVWIMPPLLVLSMYPVLTEKPFHAFHWPIGWWLVGSIAQELLFSGFIYGRMVSLFGPDSGELRGAFCLPVLFTAFLYALNHWPNIQTTEHGMSSSFVKFQFLYSFLGCAWMLNVRRWTDSVWLGVLNHILVNWLATMV